MVLSTLAEVAVVQVATEERLQVLAATAVGAQAAVLAEVALTVPLI
jgi:hypothetical protein